LVQGPSPRYHRGKNQDGSGGEPVRAVNLPQGPRVVETPFLLLKSQKNRMVREEEKVRAAFSLINYNINFTQKL
jgi:hypothetical protein